MSEIAEKVVVLDLDRLRVDEWHTMVDVNIKGLRHRLLREGLRLEVGKDIRAIRMLKREWMNSAPIPADAIARSIAYSIEQPAGVAVCEIIVRPTGGY